LLVSPDVELAAKYLSGGFFKKSLAFNSLII
jgi:hypothetical protein